mgnify:FL=1
MKKNINAFRSVHMRNAVRLLIGFCALLVIGAIALWASLPGKRLGLFSWTDKKSITQEQKKNSAEGNEAGLAGPVAVNSVLKVRSIDSSDHIMGNIGAPVQFIIYEDFQCPFCAQLYDTVEQAKAEFGSDLVVAIRHFPLASHEQALPAALAAECAGAQDKFDGMYNKLFALNKAGNINSETLRAAGKELKLDETAYAACLTKEQYKDKILAQKEEVKKLGVGGTPAGFLNEEYIPGALPYQDFIHPDGTPGLGLRTMIKNKLQKK